ncbi:MAG: tetratricopeptide repeat protein [Phycisphaerae bacterium]|nr:tetratricopeptide repeat protein [Phycisphaerae bacterium]
MKPRLLAYCGTALVLILGCQEAWQTGKLGADRHERVGPPMPDLSEVQDQPEPSILPETYLAAGRLAEGRNDLILAVSMYRKAAALNQDSVDARNRLGLVLTRLGHLKLATESLAAAVEIAPDQPYLRNNLAYSYIMQRRWKEAETELNVALELQPEFARARVNLGLVLARTGRYDDALKQFLLVLPASSAHYNLGLMYEMNRRYELASAAFSQALALDPQMGPAKIGLDRLSRRLPDKHADQDAVGVAQANKKLDLAQPEPAADSPREQVEADEPTEALKASAEAPSLAEAEPATAILIEPAKKSRLVEEEAVGPPLMSPSEIDLATSKPAQRISAEPARTERVSIPAPPLAATSRPVPNDLLAEPIEAGMAQKAGVKTLARMVSEAARWWSGQEGQDVSGRLSRQFSSPSTGGQTATASLEGPPLVLPNPVHSKASQGKEQPRRLGAARYTGADAVDLER